MDHSLDLSKSASRSRKTYRKKETQKLRRLKEKNPDAKWREIQHLYNCGLSADRSRSMDALIAKWKAMKDDDNVTGTAARGDNPDDPGDLGDHGGLNALNATMTTATNNDEPAITNELATAGFIQEGAPHENQPDPHTALHIATVDDSLAGGYDPIAHEQHEVRTCSPLPYLEYD
jgi:hypothetical protein